MEHIIVGSPAVPEDQGKQHAQNLCPRVQDEQNPHTVAENQGQMSAEYDKVIMPQEVVISNLENAKDSVQNKSGPSISESYPYNVAVENILGVRSNNSSFDQSVSDLISIAGMEKVQDVAAEIITHHYNNTIEYPLESSIANERGGHKNDDQAIHDQNLGEGTDVSEEDNTSVISGIDVDHIYQVLGKDMMRCNLLEDVDLYLECDSDDFYDIPQQAQNTLQNKELMRQEGQPDIMFKVSFPQTPDLKTRYRCDLCKKTFTRPTLVLDHKARDHGIESLFPCPECSYRGSLYRHLMKHVKRMHPQFGAHKDKLHSATAVQDVPEIDMCPEVEKEEVICTTEVYDSTVVVTNQDVTNKTVVELLEEPQSKLTECISKCIPVNADNNTAQLKKADYESEAMRFGLEVAQQAAFESARKVSVPSVNNILPGTSSASHPDSQLQKTLSTTEAVANQNEIEALDPIPEITSSNEKAGCTIHSKFFCPYKGCTKAYKTMSQLTYHKVSHTDKFKCNWEGCGKRFSSACPLQMHYRGHTGEKAFQCEYCGLPCTQKASLDIHMIYKHLDVLKKNYLKEKEMAKNEKDGTKKGRKKTPEMLPVVKLQEGPEEEKTMTKKRKYGTKPQPDETNRYPCDFPGCNVKLKHWCSMISHKASVHGPKIYKCDFEGCNKEYSLERYLLVHKVQHTTKYSCTWEGCKRKFRDSHNLRVHMRVHTGEKPLKCKLCDYSCNQNNSLNWHLKAKHSTNPVKARAQRKVKSTKSQEVASFQNAPPTAPQVSQSNPCTQDLYNQFLPHSSFHNMQFSNQHTTYCNITTQGYQNFVYPPQSTPFPQCSSDISSQPTPQTGPRTTSTLPSWPWYPEVVQQQFTGMPHQTFHQQKDLSYDQQGKICHSIPLSGGTNQTSSVSGYQFDNNLHSQNKGQYDEPKLTDEQTNEASELPQSRFTFSLPLDSAANKVVWPPKLSGQVDEETETENLADSNSNVVKQLNSMLPTHQKNSTNIVQVLTDQGQVVAAELKFHCDFPGCTVSAKSAGYIRQHKRRSHGPKTLECPVEGCRKKFADKGSLSHHREYSHSDPVVCPWEGCSKEFRNKQIMRIHMRIHTGQNRYSCPHCDYTCLQRAALKFHVVRKHIDILVDADKNLPESQTTPPSETNALSIEVIENQGIHFICDHPNCGKRLKSKETLREHKKTVHNPRIFKCQVPGCVKSYAKEKYLQVHMGQHNATYPCPWPDCKKAFRDKYNMKKHYKIHTGEKDLKCDFCDYMCIQRNSMNWHMKNKHSAEFQKLKAEKNQGLHILGNSVCNSRSSHTLSR